MANFQAVEDKIVEIQNAVDASTAFVPGVYRDILNIAYEADKQGKDPIEAVEKAYDKQVNNSMELGVAPELNVTNKFYEQIIELLKS